MELGPLLIPVLIVLSGAIALIGNAVGRNIGRRRLSLFGLRPRYTAQVITVLTGMLITVTTLVLVLALSREARIALFRLNTELQRLDTAIKNREERLRQLELGDIAYLNNQEVLRDVIDGGAPSRVVAQRVTAMVERATEQARENGIGADAAGHVLVLTPPNLTWSQVTDLVDQRDRETVVRLVASQNTLRGEPLTVFVQLFHNAVIYRKGTVLARGTVDGTQSREAIAQDLLRLADSVARSARGKVLSAPFTLVTLLPNASVDLDDHRAAITKIQQAHRPVPVSVIAASDVYTIGPLSVLYRVGSR